MNTKMKHLTPPRLFALFCAAVLSISTYAQSITVTGVVMAEGEPDPVIGANVMVKGTSNGTITDFDGNFSLDAKSGDILLISYMGYKPQEVKATTSPMRITLQADNVLLEEVVAIGYGTMKKSDLTGAVTSVSADDLLKAPVSGLDQALQGRAAGVTVTTNSGQPGEAATIRIRGIGSALGGNDPLYVVDGVITSDISFLAPNDIQSMEILKDASATAIYGSRGANGVILVTTKSGTQGKANISFDAYWGFQNRWKKLNLLNASDMAMTKLRIDAMKNGYEQISDFMKDGFNSWMSSWNLSSSPYFPVVKSSSHPEGFDYSAQETDWQDEVFQENAFMHNYNLSIDGGNNDGHYAFSVNYFNQDGTIIGSNYERLTLRFNSDYQVRKWLKIGEHLSFMYASSRNAMNNNSSPGASIISAALAMAPWDPTHYPEGAVNKEGKDLSGQIAASSNFKNVTNPFSMVEMSHPESKENRWVGDIYAEIKPIDDLTIKASMSIDNNNTRYRLYKEAYDYSLYDRADKNYISSNMYRYCSLLEEATITYAKQIGKHNFSIMAGQTWQEYTKYGIGGSGASILNPTEENWYLNRATDDRTYAGDEASRIRRISFLGRAFYNYDSRYMITANFRADASSRFTKNPWGYFPSVAVAWRLSEEPFITDAEPTWLDNLKIRAGFGQVGNDGVNNNAFITKMNSSADWFYGYPFGGELQTGAAVLSQANENGKWETNQQWDAGIDFSFWNGKLSGTVDYFRRDTKDALLYVNAPSHVGNMAVVGVMVSNVGNIRNEGFELTLNHDNTVGKVHYNIGGNISYTHNELTALNGGSELWESDYIRYTNLGMPLRTFYGYHYEGIYRTDEEAMEHLSYVDKNGNRVYSYTAETIPVHAGDARYTDQNGDGVINDDDKVNIGNSFPNVSYGINLGADFYGVDIQLFFQGVAGNKIYNALRYRTEGAGDVCTLADYMADEVWVGYSDVVRNAMLNHGVNWAELENREGTIPNPVGATTNSAVSDRFVENGAYFRLKNMQIGYALPRKLTDKFHCSRLRFYVTASNLFTVTSYSGYDPEVGNGVDYGNYPQSRTFTFGLNANF